MNWPLITVFDFVDNQQRSSLVAKKWLEKWLSWEEQADIKLTLWENLAEKISRIHLLKDRVKLNVINILDYTNIPQDIQWDAFIFWWFPNVGDVSEDFINGLKSIVRDVVEKQNKPFLWMCFWHQLLAQTFWWTIAPMDKRIIWADYVQLNNEWTRDSLFSQLNSKSFWSIWWHKRRVDSIWTDTKILWGNDNWQFQVIKVWDNAWWIQWHPDFTVDWTIWLVKLWANWINREWNNPEEIITNLKNSSFNNDSSRIIGKFVKKVVGE